MKQKHMKCLCIASIIVFTVLPGRQTWTSAQSIALASDPRDRLTFEELMAEEYRGDSPIDNGYFMPIGESAPALHPFEGLLTAPWIEMGNTAAQAVHDSNEGLRWFPPFSTQFFTHDDFLIPVERDIICPDEDHYWCIILSPGKVWSEPEDNGMSRASFPFVLVNAWANNTHNGLATFLYDDAHVSSFRFQIIQETSPDKPYQIDAWGQAPVTYKTELVENREALAAQFGEELAQQVPLHSWTELEEQHDPQDLNRFTNSYAPEEISVAGLVLDDAIYLKPPMTRYGEYPYPGYMRHGVYSVTKSMGAAIAMLRLAQKYGDEVFDLKLAEYVDISAEHDGWNDVTFGHALNMATGIGESPPQDKNPNFAGDEFKPRFRDFIIARSLQEKLNVCFSYPQYPWGAGEVIRYNSINTFVLAAAMDHFLKSREGPDALMQVLETIRPFPGEGLQVERQILLPESRQTATTINWSLLVALILIALSIVFCIYTVIQKKRRKAGNQ